MSWLPCPQPSFPLFTSVFIHLFITKYLVWVIFQTEDLARVPGFEGFPYNMVMPIQNFNP